MKLRDYQLKAKQSVYSAFRNGVQNVMLQLPTGAGKTILFSSIIEDGYKLGRRILVLAHREELIQQAHDKLLKGYGIKAGIIKAGYDPDPLNPVQIASVQTLSNRKLYKPVDIVIVDEAHHSQAKNTYGKIKDMVLSMNPNAKFLGVTATPCRTNGSGFKGVYDQLIQGISISDLIKQGHLTPPRYYVAPLHLDNIKMSAGDYNLKELSVEYQKKVHAKDLVHNWKKLASGMKTIGFAVDIEHSKTIVSEFIKQGISAAHIDGTTKREIREDTLKKFRNGHIIVLYNVGVFDEGFDLPEIEAIQLARPTKSLIKYMQMIGRGLRPAEGKKNALVLDHGGLVAEHDLVEIERNWTLDGVTKKSDMQTMAKDIESGRYYKPSEIPFDIPMERIELVEFKYTTDYMEKAKLKKVNAAFSKLKYIADTKKFSPKWVWYKLVSQIQPSPDKAKTEQEIKMYADFYTGKMNYKPGHAHFLTQEYLKNLYQEA